MLIKDLFRFDVTRDIPPVVYVHEQSPAKLAAEVSEYIITGGWPTHGHIRHDRRQPSRLLLVSRKKVTAAFDGGRLSSDSGVTLLALAERRRAPVK